MSQFDDSGLNSLYSGYFVRVVEGMFGHEVVVTKDSVAFLVYVKDRHEVLLVKQQRAPMVRDDNPHGFITEVPAGRFAKADETLTPKQLIAKEASEEIGATVREDQIELFNSGQPLAVSPGASTERQFLGVVIIDSAQLEADRTFGVDDHEQITRLMIPVSRLKTMVFEDLKTIALVSLWLASQK